MKKRYVVPSKSKRRGESGATIMPQTGSTVSSLTPRPCPGAAAWARRAASSPSSCRPSCPRAVRYAATPKLRQGPRQERWSRGSFQARPLQLTIGRRKPACAQLAHRVGDGAGDVARFLLHRDVAIEGFVAGRVGLVVADIPVEPRLEARVDEADPVEPIRKRASRVLYTSDVAMDDEAVHASLEMLGIRPALQLDFLRLPGVLAMGEGGIRIAAVGAHQPVHHEFRRARRVVPVHGGGEDHPVRADPALVDLAHPVPGLLESVVGVAAAPPMAQRLRGGDARLARKDAPAVVGSEAAQVEKVGLDAVAMQRFLGELREAVGLRDLARARAVVARGAAHDEDARFRRRILLPGLGLLETAARFEPLARQLEIGIGEAGTGAGRARRLAVVHVGVPGDRLDPRDRLLLLLEIGILEFLLQET